MGKTIIALHLATRFESAIRKHGMIFLCHRREILFQAYEKFKETFKGIFWCGIEMGELHATGMEDIIFVSVESMGREYQERIQRYIRRKPAVVVADEGHHVTEEGVWDNILTFFGVGSDPLSHYSIPEFGNPLSVFLTATPNRHDGKGLFPFVDEVAFSCSILDGIRWGWLTDIRVWQASYHADDPTDDEIDHLVQVFKDYAKDDITMFFAKSVEQSIILSDTLNTHGFKSGHVDAHTKHEERTELVRLFKDGELDVMCNRLVFTEGFDNQRITCIVDNGKTDSSTRHIQKVGRGLRPHPEANVDAYDTAEERREAIKRSPKPYLKYITTFDPTNHNLDVIVSLAGIPMRDDLSGRTLTEIVDIIQLEEEEEVDRSKLTPKERLKINLSEIDIWSNTIHDAEVLAISPLRWIKESPDAMSIYLEKNVFTSLFDGLSKKKKKQYAETPGILRVTKNGNGKWDLLLIAVGGWNGTFAMAPHYERIGYASDVQKLVSKADAAIQSEDKYLYNDLKRGDRGKPTTRQLKYLQRNGLGWDSVQTQEQALILMDHYRIQKKLVDLNLDLT